MRISVDLPAPFLTDQSMNFPAHDVEADVVESRRGAKALCDPLARAAGSVTFACLLV
jgi:hypothetical protein